MNFEDYSAPSSSQQLMCIIHTVLETVEPLEQSVIGVIGRQLQSSVMHIGEVKHAGRSNVALAKLAPILPPLFLCRAQMRVRDRMCCS
jgi:hypothetical protein